MFLEPKAEQKRSLRLTDWESSPLEQIEEGYALARDCEMRLHSHGWLADLWEAQIAFLAQEGLLEEFESEDVDIRMEELRHVVQPYTIEYRESQKHHKRRGNGKETVSEAIWEKDLISITTDEDSGSWILVEDEENDTEMEQEARDP